MPAFRITMLEKKTRLNKVSYNIGLTYILIIIHILRIMLLTCARPMENFRFWQVY